MKSLLDEQLANQLFKKEVGKLRKVMSEDLEKGDIFEEERVIFVNLPRKKDKRKFLLRIDCTGEFPLEPANYIFVNPKTKQDDGTEFWPDDKKESFKIEENPRWICLAGTREYKNRHAEHQFNPHFHTLSQTVFHIFRQINGWGRVE